MEGWKHKGKHDKPKPWDEDPNIDRWKIEKFDPSWNEGGMLEVTSFSTLFPTYRGFFSPLQYPFFLFFYFFLYLFGCLAAEKIWVGGKNKSFCDYSE